MTCESYLILPDGSRFDYEHPTNVWPYPSTIPWEVLRQVLPGMSILKSGQVETDRLGERKFRNTGFVRLSRSVQGEDGVWREDEESRMECQWVYIVDYNL